MTRYTSSITPEFAEILREGNEYKLKELGRLVGKTEEYLPDLSMIDALGEALDLALTLIPGWDDTFIVKEEK